MEIKRFCFVLFLVLGTMAYGQSKVFNTKKGFAAQGYDVVAYFDGNPAKGSAEYVTTVNGVKYKFISQESLDRFKANPAAFIPQYGGYCAYAVAVSGKKVNINPETYEIRDGKLYLFYNAGKTNTLELWLSESPEHLKSKADQNWERIIKK